MSTAAPPRGKLFCERILGNVIDHSAAGKAIDEVDLRWDECGERALRKKTSRGREVAILLPIRSHLRHGDILMEHEGLLIVVNVVPCDVLVCRASMPEQMGQIALELGNLHVPAQVVGDQIVTPDDPDARVAFLCCGLNYERAIRRFEPTRRLMPLIGLSKDFRVIRRRAI